ncbi:cytochrome c5 family protein [uncultured Cocleimonas sp.]|uniref:c-type cytochrome n=1 Tax=uncultured Cocleimonas sp. TaxID=1051587 RepID=UPI002635FF3A|nr:c-type cytochrome [uncultured Cocleimonas sp.]
MQRTTLIKASLLSTCVLFSAATIADDEAGKKTYDDACKVCHEAGIAGSPKFGDAEAWAPRIATGLEALYTTSLNGKGAMPAKGGRADISDENVKAAVDYMVKNASPKL